MFRAALIAFVLLLSSTAAHAMLVSQIDKITLDGQHSGGSWTLTLSSPISASLTYVMTSGDFAGCNICNVTANWGAAINSDPNLSSVFTATFDVWDGVSVVPSTIGSSGFAADYDPFIYLTSAPGQAFSASVTTDNDFGATVTIETIQEASVVPVPSAILLFGSALLGLASVGYRRQKSLSTVSDDAAIQQKVMG